MTKKSLAELGRYVRWVADELGLRDWTIAVHYGDPGGPERADEQRWGASVEPVPSGKRASIVFGPAFLEETPEEQRETVVHELVHLHWAALTDQTRNDLDGHLSSGVFDVFESSWTRNLEYGVDGLASAISKHFPLIEWPK